MSTHSWHAASTCSARFRRASAISAAEIARLDAVLVHRGLARSRGHARDLISAGKVRIGNAAVRKASTGVPDDVQVIVAPGKAWVGRAADKLAGALDTWPDPDGIRVRGRRCLDVGASTGGFTQVLLDQGAAQVTALDVGHGQLSPVVARDPRVEERSGTSIRDVDSRDLGANFGIVVADLSFISTARVMDTLAGMLDPDGDLVVLIKPQFEVGKAALNKHGVVTKAQDRRRAVLSLLEAVSRSGLSVRGLAASPIRGTSGNVEYLLWARSDPSGKMDDATVHAAVDDLVRKE